MLLRLRLRRDRERGHLVTVVILADLAVLAALAVGAWAIEARLTALYRNHHRRSAR